MYLILLSWYKSVSLYLWLSVCHDEFIRQLWSVDVCQQWNPIQNLFFTSHLTSHEIVLHTLRFSWGFTYTHIDKHILIFPVNRIKPAALIFFTQSSSNPHPNVSIVNWPVTALIRKLWWVWVICVCRDAAQHFYLLELSSLSRCDALFTSARQSVWTLLFVDTVSTVL